ncbi:MAG: transglutaminase family protein [Chloroflexaceae bacterium]|nr:transglutaminase family protein [Chloroflexaceae bacterium]
MYYSIRHLTRFRYSAAISESMMEVRMQPRTEDLQRCLEFRLFTEPTSQVMSYIDYLGNTIHNFSVPGRHTSLTITAEALIEVIPPPVRPVALSTDDWQKLDLLTASDDYWDMLHPSRFAHPSSLLEQFAQKHGITRDADPMTMLMHINDIIYNAFEYVPMSTTVDSPIDDALRDHKGVCQDFAHIMITLVRGLGIPCRYVSGYLFHRTEDHDRSEEDATHAWVEAMLPNLGWIGFDPTNNLIATDRHIRTAVGRDYADVPPTLGVFKGDADSELDVGVKVSPRQATIPEDIVLLPVIPWPPPGSDMEQEEDDQRQQQQ